MPFPITGFAACPDIGCTKSPATIPEPPLLTCEPDDTTIALFAGDDPYEGPFEFGLELTSQKHALKIVPSDDRYSLLTV